MLLRDWLRPHSAVVSIVVRSQSAGLLEAEATHITVKVFLLAVQKLVLLKR